MQEVASNQCVRHRGKTGDKAGNYCWKAAAPSQGTHALEAGGDTEMYISNLNFLVCSQCIRLDMNCNS